MTLWPFVLVGKPLQTLCEQRKRLLQGEPIRYAYTFPKPDPFKVRIRRLPQKVKALS